ncbi:MAG: nucleotidyltransferase domain-containing protein [Magnetococcales bacterium]|nr:nucleotidyltransferase domain-containing protein [Magnetococcales bacterium]
MTATETHLSAMVRAIVAAVQPERIILFGSHARGDTNDDSDIDLLVVEDGFRERSRWKELQKIRRKLAAFPLPKDILLYSREEVARWQHSANHIITHAIQEGRLLYERP